MLGVDQQTNDPTHLDGRRGFRNAAADAAERRRFRRHHRRRVRHRRRRRQRRRRRVFAGDGVGTLLPVSDFGRQLRRVLGANPYRLKPLQYFLSFSEEKNPRLTKKTTRVYYRRKYVPKVSFPLIFELFNQFLIP